MNLIHRIVIAILFTTLSFSTTIHVVTTGSDDTGDGSEDNPYATIQKGVDMSMDGDTVLVASGDYAGSIVVDAKSITILGTLNESMYGNTAYWGTNLEYYGTEEILLEIINGANVKIEQLLTKGDWEGFQFIIQGVEMDANGEYG